MNTPPLCYEAMRTGYSAAASSHMTAAQRKTTFWTSSVTDDYIVLSTSLKVVACLTSSIAASFNVLVFILKRCFVFTII